MSGTLTYLIELNYCHTMLYALAVRDKRPVRLFGISGLVAAVMSICLQVSLMVHCNYHSILRNAEPVQPTCCVHSIICCVVIHMSLQLLIYIYWNGIYQYTHCVYPCCLRLGHWIHTHMWWLLYYWLFKFSLYEEGATVGSVL